MIHFEDVSYTYPNNRRGVHKINFLLPQGSFTFIQGHSGAGKSTLIRLIMAMMLPSHGQIIVQGVNVNRLSAASIPAYRRQIGLVFQDHQLLFDRSVYDNIALPLRINNFPTDTMEKRINAALRRVSISHLKDEKPLNISVGEQQRVCIARAVVTSPKVLLADEPTGNLDAELSSSIMRLFYDFHATGTTVVIATHSHHMVETTIANTHTITLQQGRIL